MCWHCIVCTQPPYDKNPPGFSSTKIFTPFSNRAVCPCEVTWTEAPPTIVDWQWHFSTDCTGVLPQTCPEWAVISCFTAGADVDKNDSKRLRCFVVRCNQSRSSLYTEYASCVGPPKHQGAPLLSNIFLFLFCFWSWPAVMKTWVINYFNAVRSHPLYVKSQSNHVTWTSYSLLHETQKKTYPRTQFETEWNTNNIVWSIFSSHRLIHSLIPPPPPPLHIL